jgi:hypothetical protein
MLAAGGRVMPTRAWLLGVRLGWIMAVGGIAWSLHGRLPMGSERPGCMPPRGVVRPGRVVRFARLIHRRGRVLGGPAVRAAFGGNLSLPWLLLRVVPKGFRIFRVEPVGWWRTPRWSRDHRAVSQCNFILRGWCATPTAVVG